MNHIYMPVSSAEQWAQFLAEPTKQWRQGYSARTLAYSWQDAQGFPAEVTAALETSEYLKGAELLIAIPEHQVALPGGKRPSQTDLWALAKVYDGLVSVAVEGKVEEPFGPTVAEWLVDASEGKSVRLSFLQQTLGLTQPVPTEIRYQLLHRTASAVIEANRFNAAHALMLVHSFSPKNQWFGDYAAFAKLLGASVEVGRVVSVGKLAGVHLHLGWVHGNEAYLVK